jgi:hypothetical protein
MMLDSLTPPVYARTAPPGNVTFLARGVRRRMARPTCTTVFPFLDGRRLLEVMGLGVLGSCGSVPGSGLGEDPVDVALDGVVAQHEGFGDPEPGGGLVRSNGIVTTVNSRSFTCGNRSRPGSTGRVSTILDGSGGA